MEINELDELSELNVNTENSVPGESDLEQADLLRSTIEQNLQDVAAQIGETLSQSAAAQIYQETCNLLSHLSVAPITLARVAGTLLVYQLQATEAEELEWFKFQVNQCPDDEAVEELIGVAAPDGRTLIPGSGCDRET